MYFIQVLAVMQTVKKRNKAYTFRVMFATRSSHRYIFMARN